MFYRFFCISFSAFFLINITSFSQGKPEDFVLPLPENKISNSLYNKIEVLDSRMDTTNFGIVQKGMFNRKANVVPKISFSSQVQSILNSLIDSSAKDGTLLLQLRQFSFAELTGAFSEKGFCYIRSNIYSKVGNDDAYVQVSFIDTLILVKSADVTKPMMRKGARVFLNFLENSLSIPPFENSTYTFQNIINIDSVEKSQIKAYTALQLTDGVYLTFESFKNQTPDYLSFSPKIKREKLYSVSVENNAGKEISLKKLYALVYNGNFYVSTDFGFEIVNKINDDFIFTGKSKVTANAGDVMAAGLFFGIIGGLLASNAEAYFEMKIDHINGGFIHLRELPLNAQ